MSIKVYGTKTETMYVEPLTFLMEYYDQISKYDSEFITENGKYYVIDSQTQNKTEVSKTRYELVEHIRACIVLLQLNSTSNERDKTL